MSYCTKCGKQNPDTAKFCTGCGTPLLHSYPAPEEFTGIKRVDTEHIVKEVLNIPIKKKLDRVVILTLVLIVLIIVCLSVF